MKSIRGALVASLFAAVTLGASVAAAGQPWEPFDGVTKLVDWFAKLNAQFDHLVTVEKRAQLRRSVDRLRKDLYALEANTQLLQDQVPDERPSAEQKAHLTGLVDELMASVRRLGEAARLVGADLRLNEGEEVERALTFGLRTRAKTLTYLQQTLSKADTQPWNAQEVRERIGQGLQTVREAQLAVTKFRQKLGPPK